MKRRLSDQGAGLMIVFRFIWHYGYVLYSLLGCKIGAHMPSPAFDGACACVDLAIYRTSRVEAGKGGLSDLPEWS